MNGFFHIFGAVCAVILADDHACAGGKTNEKADEHIDDGTHRAHGGKGLVADIFAHHPGVHHVVKLLKNVAEQQRKGECNDMPGDIAGGHIHIFALSQGILLDRHKT